MAALCPLATGIILGKLDSADHLVVLVFIVISAVLIFRSIWWLRIFYISAIVFGATLIIIHDNKSLVSSRVALAFPEKRINVIGVVASVETELIRAKRFILNLEAVNGSDIIATVQLNINHASPFSSLLPGDRISISYARLRPIRGFRNIDGW